MPFSEHPDKPRGPSVSQYGCHSLTLTYGVWKQVLQLRSSLIGTLFQHLSRVTRIVSKATAFSAEN